MWLKANVPEVDIPHISVGQELEVKVTALPDRVFYAQVVAIGAASDASTRRVVVRSEIPNPGHVLKSEMFASFKIATSAGEDSPAIPSEAVIWEGEQAVVWIEREPMQRSGMRGRSSQWYCPSRISLRSIRATRNGEKKHDVLPFLPRPG